MKTIWTIAKRELGAYFTSPVAYVFIVIFLLLAGFFTFMVGRFFDRGVADLLPFFLWHPWLYLFLVPAVGMRLWSEELRLGTMELLFTMPVTPWQAILGKYFASWIFLAIALLLTFPLIVTVSYLGHPDFGRIVAGYLGSLLMAGSFLSIALLTSSLTRSQVVSFILAVVICLFLILCGWPPVTDAVSNWAPAWFVDGLASLGVMTHFESLQRGVVDSRDLVFFVSVIIFCLFTTSVVLRARRA
ncbi:MAG: ABC transporter permease subunit [Verrucomicrobia bacterium]|nr:ABC transporter permease subunit [Verrucomicrobiota bacterium]MBV9274302.1 ABC transporter permease subunit [Verrucomicrobiota bacterium]